jgi:signal transduction histidine kinase
VLNQANNTMPFERRLMVFFVANTLACCIAVLILSRVIDGDDRQGDRFANYSVLIGELLRQSNGVIDNAIEIPKLEFDREIAAICVYSNGVLLSRYESNLDGPYCNSQYQVEKADYQKTLEFFDASGDRNPVQLLIKPNPRSFMSYIEISAWWVLVLGVLLMMAWWLSTTAARKMMAPVYSLLDVIKMVTESRDYSLRADVKSDDALGVLSQDFNGMIEGIESRNQEIVKARRELEVRVREVDISNRELSNALQRLKSTQQKLINNEKMASLGALVAGVAHEINTPVGVGVTASSTLLESTRSVSEKYKKGELTNSALLQYIEQATSAANIIMSNLDRAANLIQSFKQVAVDQSNSEVRLINLKEYLDQVLLSLNPQLRATKLKCEFYCPSALGVRSYPGALSQIITNLVMNAIVHAYEKDSEGILRLQVFEGESDDVCIQFSDDGKGISAENISRVWDPFFTTNRSGGGSGLGLHIVYNLVTQQLCGNIEIESDEGMGTTISLFLPRDVGGVTSYE